MPEEKDHAEDDLLKSVDRLLAELSELGISADAPDEKTSRRIEEEMESDIFESIQQSHGLKLDGYFSVEISDDEMECYADFHPPRHGGDPIKLDDVSSVLGDKGVTFGVLWHVISDSIMKCNTELEEVTGVCIAHGTQPTYEIPEHCRIEPHLLRPPKRDTESQRVDYRQFSAFHFVNTGEVIARLIPKKPGEMGCTVTGKQLPYGKRTIKILSPGRNTEVRGKEVVATIDGRFQADSDSFWINSVLNIPGDVDFHTGNIEFDGDVVIGGAVKDGFTVISKQSIICKHTIGAARVRCDADLHVQAGILGRNKGSVRAGGSVNARFVENGYLEARGNIELSAGSINSAILTRGKLSTGQKGMIVGGRIYAAEGVEGVNFGSRMGVRTEIYCGIDFEISRKLEWIRDKSVEAAEKIYHIDQLIKAGKGDIDKLTNIHTELKSHISKLNEASIQLIRNLEVNDKAEVVARGQVFPGVYIEICNVSYVVQRSVHNVRFTLNKSTGKVEMFSERIA